MKTQAIRWRTDNKGDRYYTIRVFGNKAQCIDKAIVWRKSNDGRQYYTMRAYGN